VVEVGLLIKYVKKAPDPFVEPPDPSLRGSDSDADEPMNFAY
jgi:cytochrome d ubiquinol oxidase subunit I